jgi:hypothetical protein
LSISIFDVLVALMNHFGGSIPPGRRCSVNVFSKTKKLLDRVAGLLSSWPVRMTLLLLELWEAHPQPSAHLL